MYKCRQCGCVTNGPGYPEGYCGVECVREALRCAGKLGAVREAPTLAQFRVMRVWCSDLGAIHSDLPQDTEGYLYPGSLYIALARNTKGAWLLTLENGEYLSDDLAGLETRLHEFYVREFA